MQRKRSRNYLNRGSLTEATSHSQSWTIRNQFEYARLFNEMHFVSFVFGQEASSSKYNSFTNYSPEFDPSKSIIGYPDVANITANRLDLNSTRVYRRGAGSECIIFYLWDLCL